MPKTNGAPSWAELYRAAAQRCQQLRDAEPAGAVGDLVMDALRRAANDLLQAAREHEEAAEHQRQYGLERIAQMKAARGSVT